jgi:hypothetical protein
MMSDHDKETYATAGLFIATVLLLMFIGAAVSGWQ